MYTIYYTIIIAGATKTIIHVVIKFPSKRSFCLPYLVKLKACLRGSIYLAGSSKSPDVGTAHFIHDD
jgi:hypothetical protein